MFGNGLRPVIWKEFKKRFNIKKIAEFYGATEGNASVVNYTGKEGACGFLSQILPKPITNFIYPVSFINYYYNNDCNDYHYHNDRLASSE